MQLTDYLSLFPASGRDKPRFMALAEVVLKQVTDLIPLTEQLLSGFSVASAEGVQLDALGASFGLKRADTAAGAGASDEVFRQFLLAKLDRWTWDGTNEGVPAVLAKICPGSSQRDNGNGTVTASPGGALPAAAEDLFPVPAGVRTET